MTACSTRGWELTAALCVDTAAALQQPLVGSCHQHSPGCWLLFWI